MHSFPMSPKPLYRVSMVLGSALLLCLGLVWVIPYHDAVSNFIGARFIWLPQKEYKWAGALVQAFLIEATVCFPLTVPIALIYRRFALIASIMLALPVVGRALLEMSIAPKPPFGAVLVGYHAFAHLLFLCAGALLARRWIYKNSAT